MCNYYFSSSNVLREISFYKNDGFSRRKIKLKDLNMYVLLMIETTTIGGFVIENMCYICFYMEILFCTLAITINNILGPV